MDRFFAYDNYHASNKKEKAKTAEKAKKKILNLLSTKDNQIEDILNSLKTNFDLYYKNNTSFRSDFCDFYDYYQGNARDIVYNLAYHPERYKKGLLSEMANTDGVINLSKCFTDYKGKEKDSLFEEIRKNGWENKRKILRIIFCYLKKKSSLTSKFYQICFSKDRCAGDLIKIKNLVETYATYYKEIQAGEKITYTINGVKKQEKLDKSLLKEGTMFSTLVSAQRQRMPSLDDSFSINS